MGCLDLLVLLLSLFYFLFFAFWFCAGFVVVGQEQGSRGGSWKEDESLKREEDKFTPSPTTYVSVMNAPTLRAVQRTQQEISLSLHYNCTNPTVSLEESLNSLWRYFLAYCLCAVSFYVLLFNC